MSDVDGLRAQIAEAHANYNGGEPVESRDWWFADAILPVVTAYAEQQARQRAAEELRAAAEEIHALAPDLDWDDWLRARAAALTDDGQP